MVHASNVSNNQVPGFHLFSGTMDSMCLIAREADDTDIKKARVDSCDSAMTTLQSIAGNEAIGFRPSRCVRNEDA